MRVGIVVSQFPALSETFILNHITGLIDRGMDVQIFANRPGKDKIVHADVTKYKLLDRTHYRPKIPQNYLLRLGSAVPVFAKKVFRNPAAVFRSLDPSLKRLFSTAAHLDGPKCDIYHAHFGQNGLRLAQVRAAGAFRAPIVTQFHGIDVARQSNQYDFLFQHGESLLTISQRWLDTLKSLGAPDSKLRVHHCGVDVNRFALIDRRAHPQPVRALSVARLVEKKGIEFAIAAMTKLRDTNIHYDIIGHGPLHDSLQSQITSAGLINVTLHGSLPQEKVREFLERADILLAPSVTASDGDMEGIPVSLMEAMATGLPVISTHHSGIGELVLDGVAGFLLKERDVDGLAEKLKLLASDAELRHRMGIAGRAHVVEQFNIDRLNDVLIEHYRELLRGTVNQAGFTTS